MNAKTPRRAAEQKLDIVPEVIDAALASEQTAWADYPKCGKRVRVSVPDWSSRLPAVEVLVRLADKGKSGRVKEAAAPGYVVDDRLRGRALTDGDRHKYLGAVAPKLFPPYRSGASTASRLPTLQTEVRLTRASRACLGPASKDGGDGTFPPQSLELGAGLSRAVSGV